MIYKTLSESVKYLILDGTQWKRGEKCVHLLTLCIVYHGIAIPIYWQIKLILQLCSKKVHENLLNTVLSNRRYLSDVLYLAKQLVISKLCI